MIGYMELVIFCGAVAFGYVLHRILYRKLVKDIDTQIEDKIRDLNR